MTDDRANDVVVAAEADDTAATVVGAIGDETGTQAAGAVVTDYDQAVIVAVFADQNTAIQAYQTLKDETVVMIHPSTVLDSKPQWVMYNEFLLTSKNYVRTVTVIQPEWLFEMSEEYFDLDEFKNSEARRKLERIIGKRL